MPFGPIVTSAGLSKDKVVRSEYLTEGSRPHGVHGARLQIHKHRSRHIFATFNIFCLKLRNIATLCKKSNNNNTIDRLLSNILSIQNPKKRPNTSVNYAYKDAIKSFGKKIDTEIFLPSASV